jgi:hypothetical protein
LVSLSVQRNISFTFDPDTHSTSLVAKGIAKKTKKQPKVTKHGASKSVSKLEDIIGILGKRKDADEAPQRPDLDKENLRNSQHSQDDSVHMSQVDPRDQLSATNTASSSSSQSEADPSVVAALLRPGSQVDQVSLSAHAV